MTPDRTTASTSPQQPMLQVDSVVMRFGGLLALGGIDLTVAHGERLVILGPNGAGKSTLFNVIAGDLAPTSGTVTIKGTDCSTLPSRRRPGMGVARTYQKARSFPDLTVEENLYLAVVGKEGRHRSLRPLDAGVGDRIGAALDSVWLADKRNALVSGLSHGEKRQLEVGMAVITDPDLMLLDEPSSGLSRGERERLIELLQQLGTDTTLLLIEHDMDVAFQVAQRIFVMADGLEVAQGTPAEIRENQLVHDIYLGSEAA